MWSSMRLLGGEHPDILAAMSNLTVTCSFQGKLGEAPKLEEKVLEARIRLLREEHRVR